MYLDAIVQNSLSFGHVVEVVLYVMVVFELFGERAGVDVGGEVGLAIRHEVGVPLHRAVHYHELVYYQLDVAAFVFCVESYAESLGVALVQHVPAVV